MVDALLVAANELLGSAKLYFAHNIVISIVINYNAHRLDENLSSDLSSRCGSNIGTGAQRPKVHKIGIRPS